MAKQNFYAKLQEKYGDMWVATSNAGRKVYAASRDVGKLYDKLSKKDIEPQKTVIGYIEKPRTVAIYN